VHREGTDPNNVQIEDVLCDFCGVAAWAQDTPCVEGHQGSLICGDCLSEAYETTAHLREGSSAGKCTMCLEKRDEPDWSGTRAVAIICRRCVKQSAGVLHKAKDWDWSKPTNRP